MTVGIKSKNPRNWKPTNYRNIYTGILYINIIELINTQNNDIYCNKLKLIKDKNH